MELRHFKMIKAVAEVKNLTKAAENLYLSQSALSHQLKEIETFFDTQIFIRHSKQMLLTEAGKIILVAGENILKELELVKQRIKTLNNENEGEIRVTTECYTSYHWLSKFMKDFKYDHPQVLVRINADATYKTVTSLLNNEIDIGILEENTNNKLLYTPLFQDEFYALVSTEHRWANRKTVRQEDFADESYIMYNIPCEESTIYSMLFKEKRPKELYKIALTEAIVEMVKAGIGVAVMPNWIIKPYLPLGGMVAVPIRRAIKRTWYAAVLKSKMQPVYVQTFINNLASTLKTSEEYALAEVV
ncbi:LysR family transcriptional regulator [Segetibacter koreensis]|uniref:LysR family transcriptional regulator n=1 Tax=Segetibacter koreensis TaxID=398037 RepID=UPI00035D27C0|nr:LysR family transcriptional regulator [Segetibacter koreensis]